LRPNREKSLHEQGIRPADGLGAANTDGQVVERPAAPKRCLSDPLKARRARSVVFADWERPALSRCVRACQL